MRELPNSNISVKLHLQKFQKKSVKEILHCMHGKQVCFWHNCYACLYQSLSRILIFKITYLIIIYLHDYLRCIHTDSLLHSTQSARKIKKSLGEKKS